MERITRDKLVKKVADNLQDKSINFSIPYHGKYKKKYSQQIIETVLTELLNTTIAELEKGNAVVIREYFSIKPVWRDSKNARNVATGEKVVIPARYQLKVKAARFLKEAWNPQCFKRTYEGKGYLGTNNVDCKSPEFYRWTNMVQRCYNKKIHKYKPYYKDKSVCEEWLNFANFRIWYREHIIEGAKVDLDKDILCQGNKVYSPETCVFVEHYINTVFEDRSTKRRIVENKEKQYETYMTVLNKNISFGTFNTKEEAEKGYVTGKKNYILKLADSCKGKVQDCLYNAMVNWNVELRN